MYTDDTDASVGMLKDFSGYTASLVAMNYVASTLRTRKRLFEITCTPQDTFQDILELLRLSGCRDESVFLMKLMTKVSFLTDLEEEIVDRFHGCEVIDMESEHGEPLVLCCISGSILASFPTNDIWRQSVVKVDFDEMNPEGEILRVSEVVDNISDLIHVEEITARYFLDFTNNSKPTDVWVRRNNAFPNLSFSPDVENQLNSIQQSDLVHVIDRLFKIDSSAARWRKTTDPTPNWVCPVVPEKANTLKNRKLREARTFTSCEGGLHLFEWHARFTRKGRIHLRFSLEGYLVEVGYIGAHLPLQ